MCQMKDSLADFDWAKLEEKYKNECEGKYQSMRRHFDVFTPSPQNELDLYRWICSRFTDERATGVRLDTYRAMLFWKLYSTGLKHFQRLGKDESPQQRTQDSLRSLNLPDHIDKNLDTIVQLANRLYECQLYAMGDCNRYAVRTTFLHFAYPSVIPILDKMTLRAVGRKDANMDDPLLREYVAHVRTLAGRYAERFAETKLDFTPVRLVEMALWVHRGV